MRFTKAFSKSKKIEKLWKGRVSDNSPMSPFMKYLICQNPLLFGPNFKGAPYRKGAYGFAWKLEGVKIAASEILGVHFQYFEEFVRTRTVEHPSDRFPTVRGDRFLRLGVDLPVFFVEGQHETNNEFEMGLKKAVSFRRWHQPFIVL